MTTQSTLGRRLGAPIAAVSLAVTAAMVAWAALGTTAIAGDLAAAPFTVPATLVTPPDGDGCVEVVAGDGTGRTHCVDGNPDTAWFTADGEIALGWWDDDRGVLLDERTGATTPGPSRSEMMDHVKEPYRLDESWVGTDGDRVVLYRDDGRHGDEGDETVLLDLAGPPGFSLQQGAVSPDGAWVLAVTGAGEIVVAPADGSAAPHVWGMQPDDEWIDLHSAIWWDD